MKKTRIINRQRGDGSFDWNVQTSSTGEWARALPEARVHACVLHPPQRMQSLQLFSRARKSAGPTRHTPYVSERPRKVYFPGCTLSPRFGPHCCRFVLRPYVANNLRPTVTHTRLTRSGRPRRAANAVGPGLGSRRMHALRKDGQTPSTPARHRVRRTPAHVGTGAS
jgi:hypothetical protein